MHYTRRELCSQRWVPVRHTNSNDHSTGLFSGIIDYNFLCFRDAIQKVFEVRNKYKNTTVNSRDSPVVNGGEVAAGDYSGPGPSSKPN